VIKAIFFDWFNTLANFKPPRHEFYQHIFHEFGIELSLKEILRGILTADQYYFAENAKSPVRERSPQELAEVYSYYPKAVLAEAGVDAPSDLPLKIVKTAMQQFAGITVVLFDDVLSTLETLKGQKLTLGLLTNAEKGVVSFCDKLGLNAYLDFVVTSEDAGVEKPKPGIFLAALERAGVKAPEAIHVGDQYNIDVVGARGVGINPILIDRYDIFPEVDDCPRIHALAELAQYL